MHQNTLFLSSCLSLTQISKTHFDMLSDAGLPSMGSLYGNIQAPSLNDLGGSLGDKAQNLNQGVNNAYGNYTKFAQSLPNPFGTYQKLLSDQGIPELQKTSETLQGNINDLENQINRVSPNVSANTANSLVTEGQRQGMVSAQQYPLQLGLNPLLSNFGTVQNALQTQEQNVGNEVSALNTGNQQMLNVGGMGVTVAQDNAARAMTGYTQDADNILKGLLQKMQVTGTLDQAEWQTMSTLAAQKQAYNQKLNEVAQTANYTFGNATPGSYLYNTGTGKGQLVP